MKNLIATLFVLLGTNLFAQTFTDVDIDDDGLIEVNDLETLNAMRYQLDGSGLQLDENAVEITTGCAPGGCKGYELTRDLDFSSADSYQNIANLKRWTDGDGWQPIGDATHPFTAIFKTNNGSTPNVIYNLMINRPGESGVGLFGHIGSGAKISGIGLLNAEITGHSQVGGLVGKSAGGDISNSYVSGRVVGKGIEVGLLAGSSSGLITNSYANGEVSGEGNGVGGLVGASSGSITNSYAMGSVVGAANHVGGLVGNNSQGTISNSYTTGSVSGSEDIGGLVGISNLGKLIGNYVSGKTSGKRYIGGLVGINVGGTITRSYWDKTTNKLQQNTGGVGLSASELQSQSAQDDDLNKPYYKWSTANWDFGTAEQYPILKYATGSDSQNPACGPGQALPNCGALLLGQHASLERIMFSEQVDLSPTFKPTELNYQLNIIPQVTQLQLTPIASNPDSTIRISRNGVAVGTTSSVVALDKDTSITMAVSAPNQRPVQYQFAVNYRHAITILGIPNEAIDEGELIILNASHSLDTPEDQINYRWTQTTGKAILSKTANESSALLLFIPADYVSMTEDYAGLGLSIEVTDGKTTFNKKISLMITKKDNGNIAVGSPNLSDLELTVPEIDLSEDSDGAGKNLSYQWQHRLPSTDAEWKNIDGATNKTYTIPISAEWFTEYRVLINYTDGQGYETIATSEATQYPSEEAIQDFIQSATPQRSVPENAMSSQASETTTIFNCADDDIDDDNDGLIEICDLEGLNAIRFVLDGSGYKSDATATVNTTGCPTIGCKGYELIRDLDFNDDNSYSSTANKVIWTTGSGWEPIGNYVDQNNVNNNPFMATFEGNGHTISNLMIYKPNTDYTGLFGYGGSETAIANIGLLRVYIIGNDYVGGLVGSVGGSITNSYAAGSVAGGEYVGGLVGINYHYITGSYAVGSVTGNKYVGGLVARSYDDITGSYAAGSVTGDEHVGGLVGINDHYIISSYAVGSVTGNQYVGGLVGLNMSMSHIVNTYASVFSTRYGRSSFIGGLVGFNYYGFITDSYWNIETSHIPTSDGGIGKNKMQLQSPTTATGIYSSWSTTIWDFGNSSQYPVLKHTRGDKDNPACRNEEDTTKNLLVCSDLLSPTLRYGLSDLSLVRGNLLPNFNGLVPKHEGTVVSGASTIQFRPIAVNPNAKIYITTNGGSRTTAIKSGNKSSEIWLNTDGITEITIEVENGGETTQTVAYTLYLSYYKFEGDVDQDDDGLIEIDNLEKLNAIRYQLDGTGYRESRMLPKITIGCPSAGCRGYELIRDLDFNDDNSYSSTANKVIWTTGTGWQPIDNYYRYVFNATFNGNGHTISNLMIYRPNADNIGLFDYTGSGAKVINLGLLNADITGSKYVGGLVGRSNSTIMNSYAAGSVTGDASVGGLVGQNNSTISNRYGTIRNSYGTIMNSYAAGSVTGDASVGGLVGRSYGTIMNSYAESLVTGDANVGGLVGSGGGSITNSYAESLVTGDANVGGLVGSGGGSITNSYAASSVTGTAFSSYVGGLVGWNYSGSITNSYAAGSVSGGGSIGGLVGRNYYSRITNSYAAGSVSGDGSIGGLVGWNSYSTIWDSYATGSVEGSFKVGGLIGNNASGVISSSYWNTETSGMMISAGGIGKTTVELQSASAQSTDRTQPYYWWDDKNWDFGNSSQYPILKYAKGSDRTNLACGDAGKPECGKLLLGQISFLDQLAISGGTLSQAFDDQVFSYTVMVNHNVKEITLNTTATDASISIISNTTATMTGTGVASATIPLKIAGSTVITVEVTKGNQWSTSYVITVSHNLGNPTSSDIEVEVNKQSLKQQDISANEGDSLELKLGASSCNMKCEWSIPNALISLLPDGTQLNGDTITFANIPADYLTASEDTRQFTITVAARREGGIARRQITLTITKTDSAQVIEVGQPTLNGSSLIAPDLPDLSMDSDGVNDNPDINYQWQQLKANHLKLTVDENWMDIADATTSTYTPNPNDGKIYRVGILYTDGQGYRKPVYSQAVMDIDTDDDGLIEIRTLEDLYAIRNNLLGTSYKTGELELTMGCPNTGCKGYELTRDLDFSTTNSYSLLVNKATWTVDDYEDREDKGWEPIGDDIESFGSTFKGNNYTISNLMINSSGRSYAGLFGMSDKNAMIDGVHLHKANIIARNYVGALVGKNVGGTITNSSVSGDSNTTLTQVVGEDHVGGLVGANASNSMIDNVDVYGVRVRGKGQVGGLVGTNDKSTIKNSRVGGDGNIIPTEVEGGEDNKIGGLVGENVNNGDIISSYAIANVRAMGTGGTIAYYVGGLVGHNAGRITDSYAGGSVEGNAHVGGLVGRHEKKRIKNSYARATVKAISGDNKGGLIGSGNANVKSSYWDTNVMSVGTHGEGKTTGELQEPTTATEIYKSWSTNVWDFGTDKQYPALKYYDASQCSQTNVNAPEYCGVLFVGQRNGLQSLQLSDNAILEGNFSNKTYKYEVTIGGSETAMSLMPTAAYPTAEIKLYKGGDNINAIELNGGQFTDISLAGISTMTIVVKDARSEKSYLLEIKRFNVRISRVEGVEKMDIKKPKESILTFNEGDMVKLEVSGIEAGLTYEWMHKPPFRIDLLRSSIKTNKQVNFEIPADYVVGDASSSTAIIKLRAVLNKNGKELIINAEKSIKIKNENNDSINNIGQPTINGLVLTAPQIDLSDDPDGVNANPGITYQWQSFAPGKTSWQNEKNETNKTYKIADTAVSGTRYLVQLTYTDGQGYSKEVLSQSITYVDIDKDDNGLIDIYQAQQLNAIRYQLDGTSYKESGESTATMKGCPSQGCKGYELKAHIDLKDYANWQPIGDSQSPFSAIFEGNAYTIINLKIDDPTNVDVGLFGRITQGAEIRKVGLINVDIRTDKDAMNNVGGLVGYNDGGMVSDSYVIGRKIEGGERVGALVGNMSGGIARDNYATIDSLKQKGISICQAIGGNSSGTAENNTMVGGCNSGLFECPADDPEKP